MAFLPQNEKSQQSELDRRKFLSTATTAVGLLALGLNPIASLGEGQPSGKQESGKCAGTPSCETNKGLYQISQLSEQEILRTYTALIEDACRFAKHSWKSSSFDPNAGYWGDGVSVGNGGIRTTASMLLASGALLKYDDGLAADERRDLLEKSTATLRYVTSTHVTGTQKCTDNKQWGATEKFGSESWQSGMWTGTLSFGAWLIWERLDRPLQQAFERLVASECDILSRRQPPNGLWLDTKAEENGWEVPCLVLGELMFPSHPNAPAWHEAALRYMMNVLCTEADKQDATLVDGRPVSQWVKGANLQPDFTLENHSIFHPSYVGCSCYFLTQAVMYYTYGGKRVPQAATHHLMDTWKMFRTIILPWGEAAYPQGMDWELHGLTFMNLYASLATHNKDAFAAHMEQSTLQYKRAWQKMAQGDLALAGSPFGIGRHAIDAEQAAYGLLAHKVFGPAVAEMTARETAAQEQGVREYPYVDFVAHRTQEKFASFSWKNRIMGVLIPTAEGHGDNPNFTVPIPSGFVGAFELTPPAVSKPSVIDHSHVRTVDGFETSGTLLLNGGRLKQTLKMISVGSQTVVYEDRVVALSDVVVQGERGVPIGIENDSITGGTRVVSSRDGQTIFDWKKPRSPVDISGSWVNIDGRMAVVTMAGTGVVYAQASGYTSGISVYSDIMYCSYSDQPRQFKAGDVVAHRLAIFYVEVTPEETSVLAQSCRIEQKHGDRVLHFKRPDGKNAEMTHYKLL